MITIPRFPDNQAELAAALLRACCVQVHLPQKGSSPPLCRRRGLDLPEHTHTPTRQRKLLRPDVILRRVGILLGSFPTLGPHSPETFVSSLADNVAAVSDLGALSLESACREIVTTLKTMPPVPEVIEILERHIWRWKDYGWLIEHIENWARDWVKDERRKDVIAAGEDGAGGPCLRGASCGTD
jgi:hypothetical protein